MKFGDKVRDTVTGFTGTYVSRAEYLHGVPRIGIQATLLDKDGRPLDEQWFDEPRVEPAP